MALFSRSSWLDPDLPKTDQGSGSFRHYGYNLAPNRKSVVIELANSDPYQDVLRDVLSLGETEPDAYIPRRTIEEERVDAPTAVRLFVNRRPTGIVGFVPRGLESPVEAALARIADRGQSERIATTIKTGRHGIRVILKIGLTK